MIIPPEVAEEARAKQTRLAELVRLEDDFPDLPRRIAALDAHFDTAAGLTFAAAGFAGDRRSGNGAPAALRAGLSCVNAQKPVAIRQAPGRRAGG